MDVLDPRSVDASLVAALSWAMFISAALVLGVVLVLLVVSLLAGRSSGAEPLSSRRAWSMVVAGGLALPATAAFGIVVASPVRRRTLGRSAGGRILDRRSDGPTLVVGAALLRSGRSAARRDVQRSRATRAADLSAGSCGARNRLGGCASAPRAWVGFPSVKAIVGQKFAPWLADRILAKSAWDGQMADEEASAEQPGNLFEPVPGDVGAHGRFDSRARERSWQLVASRHRGALVFGVCLVFALAARWIVL